MLNAHQAQQRRLRQEFAVAEESGKDLHCQWTPTWPLGQHLLWLVALASPHPSLLRPLVVGHTPEQSRHLDVKI